ncbi:MAG: DUF167 family protein [Burkholderiales bacterium]|jgi:uncharacterized protein YggU (UPF0235/DUF167 family)|nr:DUF167 family protein [Burkholderiales bacterium]
MAHEGRPWREMPHGLDLAVRLTPRGGRDAIEGVETLSDGRRVLKARVRAVPEAGKANAALARLVAAACGVAATQVSLASGATARVKSLHIEGDAAALAAALARTLGA